MVGRMVRFFLGVQREGLAQEGQTHQQEDQQGSPGMLKLASQTNTMVVRSYGLRLPENSRSRG
jgi:hypothetical protein